jgi:hypothetical protein
MVTVTREIVGVGRLRKLIAAIGVAVVLSLVVGVAVWLLMPHVEYRLVSDFSSADSNIVARGYVTEMHPNYTSYGFGTPNIRPYHVFPMVVAVNLTEIQWTADGVDSSLAYWKGQHSLGVQQLRDVALAYDASDVPELVVGQPVEFSGHYSSVTDGVNSFFVTISPNVNGSYLRPTELPLPASAAPQPGYLTIDSYIQTEVRETRIFLVSSSAKYSVYPEDVNPQDPRYPDMHKGDPCIIIQATLRNDYSEQNPPVSGFATASDGKNFSLVAFTTNLYDATGRVSAVDVTPSYPSGLHNIPQHGLPVGETVTIQIYKATSNRDIDRYEFFISYLGSAPIP